MSNIANKQYLAPRPREETAAGITQKVKTGCGNLYITINKDSQERLCEVFTNTGRSGCASQSEATSRIVSIALRSGVDPKALVEQLRGIRCFSCIRNKNNGVEVLSCPDAIGRVLESCVNNSQKARDLSMSVKEHEEKSKNI